LRKKACSTDANDGVTRVSIYRAERPFSSVANARTTGMTFAALKLPIDDFSANK